MRRLPLCLGLALLGCAPPPDIGGDDDATSSVDSADSADSADSMDSADSSGGGGSGSLPPPGGDLDPDQLDRSEPVGPCGYPGPGSAGYGTEVGQRMANNTTQLITTCGGDSVQLADYMCDRGDGKNNRAILVNIGAGWCLPCQEETLEFPELYSEYRDEGLEILQIMFQDWEALAPTAGFCEEWESGSWADGSLDIQFPVLLDQVFDWGSIYLQDPQSATPVNILIDANGNIRWKLTGQKPSLDVLRAQIDLVIQNPYAPPS